jgi:hypothetical protein
MVAAMNLAGMTTVAQAHTVAFQEQPTDAVEQFRRGERAAQQQPTSADTRRPRGQPDWLPGIGVLAAVLALVAGLVVMATKRTGRRVRAVAGTASH